MVLACSLVACPPGPAPAEPLLSAHRFPTHLVTGPDASRVREIFREHSISRKHRSRFESTPKVYRYLLERIPLAATLIRVLRFGKYKITERPGGVLTVDSGVEGLSDFDEHIFLLTLGYRNNNMNQLHVPRPPEMDYRDPAVPFE